MSDYVKSTDFATKDTLPSGDSAKIVRGTEIDAEFEALEVAIASKANTSDVSSTYAPLNSPALTGSPTAPTPTSGDNDTSIATTAFVSAITGTNGINGFKNRIINGAMVIDQRNAGTPASLTSSQTYFLDRWFAVEDTDGTMTIQQSSTAPAGFTNSAVLTTGTADASLGATQLCYVAQKPEGYNVADFGWGTANASTVTLSFWVRSSLTGTFGGAVTNNAFDRSYPFTYTISAANTWEQKTVTIAGDTSGTWLKTNGAGMQVFFGLGVGSTYSGTASAWAGTGYISATGATSVIGAAGATFYITGVQLEKGTQATSFDFRSYGTELALCQRYFETTDTTIYSAESAYGSGVYPRTYWWFKVTKRASPTVTNSGASASGSLYVASVSGVGLNNSLGASAVFGNGATASSEL